MKKFRQLSIRERYQIETLLQNNLTPAEIARRVGRHRSTIYREIAKGRYVFHLPSEIATGKALEDSKGFRTDFYRADEAQDENWNCVSTFVLKLKKWHNDGTDKGVCMKMTATLAIALILISACARFPAANKNAENSKRLIIAHRGASGYAPEHTLEAYAIAHAMNVDYVEPDVVMTKDGQLVVLHDPYLDTTTDVRKKFPWRNRPDGRYHAIDFTLQEIKTLYVSERLDEESKKVAYPQRFPTGRGFFRVPTLDEVIELVQGLNRSRQKNIGLYIEPKAPASHLKQGKNIMKALHEKLKRYELIGEGAKVIVQCFDSKVLKKFRKDYNPKFPLVQLLAENSWQESDDDFTALMSDKGLAEIASYAQGIGPWIPHLMKYENGQWVSTGLSARAKALKLMVHAYTLRADDLPKSEQSPESYADKVFAVGGADGIFADHPDRVRR